MIPGQTDRQDRSDVIYLRFVLQDEFLSPITVVPITSTTTPW